MSTTTSKAKAYLAKHEIPQLFESLMTGMLYNQPDDHIQFLSDCILKLKENETKSVKWNTFIDVKLKSPLPPIVASGSDEKDMTAMENKNTTGITQESEKSTHINAKPTSPTNLQMEPKFDEDGNEIITQKMVMDPLIDIEKQDNINAKPLSPSEMPSTPPRDADGNEIITQRMIVDPPELNSLTQPVESIPDVPVVFVMGGPGSGKHEQSSRLTKRYKNWVHLSIGDLYRKRLMNEKVTIEDKWNLLGDLVQEGEVDASDVDIQLVCDSMKQYGCAEGFLIEGYPTNMNQLESYKDKIGRIDFAFYLDCETEAVEERLLLRLEKENTITDLPDAIKARIQKFREETVPVIKSLDKTGRLIVVNGDRDTEHIFYDICTLFDNAFYRSRGTDNEILWNFNGPLLKNSVKAVLPPFRNPDEEITTGDETVPTSDLDADKFKADDDLVKNANAESRPNSVSLKIDQISLTVKDTGRKDGFPKVPIVFLLGGPGSGKGVQCSNLTQRYPNLLHLSLGDILRKHIVSTGSGEDKWSMVGKLISQGEMAPEDTVIELLVDEIKQKGQNASVIIVEGFPRDKDQLESFNRQIGGLTSAILLDCEEFYMRRRLLDRQASTGRIDDNEQAIEKRLKFFKLNTMPVVNHFYEQGKLIVIHGDRDSNEVFFDLSRLMDFVIRPKVKRPAESSMAQSGADAKTNQPITGDKGNPHHTAELNKLGPQASSQPVCGDKGNPEHTAALDAAGAEALKKCKVIFVVGGPGCGKGTQCERIVNKYGWTHLSSGDLLRAEVASGTSRGKELDATMKRGELVSLDVVLTLIREAMLKHAATSKGFLIDGYPREVEQGERFEKEVAQCTFVFYFNVSDETMKSRLLGRAKTSGRVDDNEETIVKRLDTFHRATKPVVDHYGKLGKLREIKAEGTVEDIFKEVQKILDSC